MSNIFDFGEFQIHFDDENREAFAYKNLDTVHDYVYEDDDEDEYDDEWDDDDHYAWEDDE